MINIPRGTDYKDFQLKLDELLEAIDWENLDLEQKCLTLQQTLLEAGRATCGCAPRERSRRKMKKTSRSLRELKRRKKFQEKLVKKISALKSRKIAAGKRWSLGEEGNLQEKLETHRITADKLANKLFDMKMN